MKRFKYLTLVALVAFAACDEDEAPVVAPPVTGSVSGVVTIEGTAASGVSVTLSSGATATTDGSGAYSFSGVTAGAYTVTISGFASDATFSSTTQAVTISTAGQVATANFDGSYIRTAAILGSVAAGGVGLANVTVAISGQSSASTLTDTNGQYSFSGLRAGSYTVAMTNPDASTYSFGSTSSSVTLAAGGSEVVSFSGSLLTTAKITGALYIDENDNNNSYDGALLEDKLAVAGVAIMLEGGSILDTVTVLTDANGDYEFTNLAAGTYRLTIDAVTNVPASMVYGLASPSQIVTVTTGATGVANWPFDIVTQSVSVYAFLGTDADVSLTPGPGHAPMPGLTLYLYDTQANAAAGGAAGRLDTEVTDANGLAAFTYARTADDSPGGGEDNIVFAAGGPEPTNFAGNGEGIIEIAFNPKFASVMASDTFDLLNGAVAFSFDAQDVRGNDLAGWTYQVFLNDTTAAPYSTAVLNAKGEIAFADVADPSIPGGALPITFYFDLTGAQALANGHGFKQVASANRGSVVGSYVAVVHNGLTLKTDTVAGGTQTVSFTDENVQVRVHDEEDDSTATPTFTAGDALPAFNDVNVEIYDSAGTSIQGPLPVLATGEATFVNVPVGKTYTVRARSNNAVLDMLNDTIQTIVLIGDVQADTINSMGGAAGYSTFAFKHNDANLGGYVRSADLTAANGIAVKITATADNIQPNRGKDTTLVIAASTYNIPGMREGPYMVQVFDSVTATGDSIWAFLGVDTATTDMTGAAAVSIVNFTATRMDTKVMGVVVNDRDSDFNTLDPDEALSGVTINLIDDADGDGAIDAGEATLATTTTDAAGAYSFTKLREDAYIVQAVSPANATVLRALSATGAVTAHVGITTAAAVGAGATLNQSATRQAGNASPPGQSDEFPRWNYLTGAASADGGALGGGAGPNATNGALTTAPTNFVHLFNTGTANGQIVSAAPGGVTAGVGAAGVRVTITRCQTAAAQPSPPAAGVCTAKHGLPSPHIKNIDTDSNGDYTFGGLLEGVYQIDVAPATAGYTTNEGPDDVPGGADVNMLVTIKGDGDIETVADYVIS